jgi:acyl dehydratase
VPLADGLLAPERARPSIDRRKHAAGSRVNLNDEPVYVGRDFGGRELVLDRGLVESYVAALGSDYPLYARFAPALVLHSECYRDLGWYLKNIFGNLHARQEWELFHAVEVGQRVRTRSFIRERYHKRGREYVVKETWTLDEAGRLLNRGLTHQSFLTDAVLAGTRDKDVVDKSREKDAARRFEAGGRGGAELAPLVKTVDERTCRLFSGPGDNYHTDRTAARALGFPDIVVQGMLPICLLSDLLTREFGEGWLAGGKIDVRLVNVLWANETVSAKAEIVDEAPEAARTRVTMDAWVEKRDGAKVVVGKASALR